MSELDKCKTYRETQSSIKKLLEKGIAVEKNLCLNQLVLIKSDLTSKNENVKKAAIEMLEFLVNLNNKDVQTEIIKSLLDSTVNKLAQGYVLRSIKKKVKQSILEDTFDFTEALVPWKNQNVNKFTNILEEICLNDLSKDKCKEFFIFNVIPTMLDLSTDNEIRNILVDIAFMLSTIVPISDLSQTELEMFLRDVNVKYVKNIGELRDKDYQNWHNLWIFLVRFCDENIHNSMELTNRLLRVVEYAFRNSSIQQRLKGYDCWKELIDNASLDMKHMCSAKQIKLLVTPLKAKFSKQEVVICKRFDVFAYLLEKLQHKAVLCLTEFLEFCFGPIGENKDATKVGQGKTVPQIWTKSTKVLVDLIGHSHGQNISCLTTEDVIKLEKPVINPLNISLYYKVIINSVSECGSLLKEVDIESKRETVLKCMWKSIFNLIIPTVENARSKYFQVIADVFDDYIKQSRENPYFEDLLILITTVLLSYDKEFVYEVIQYVLKQLLTVIFTTDNFPSNVADNFKTVLSHAFSKMLMMETKLKVIKEIMFSFMKTIPNDDNICQINKIWVCAATEIVSDFTVKQIEEFCEFNSFLMWPAYQLHHLDDAAKKQTVLHWMKIYRKITMENETRKLGIMRELEKIFKNNPLLNSNVVSLLNVMSQFETKFTKEFVITLMSVCSHILFLPILKTEDEQKITALVMQYFEPSLECYKTDQNEDVIKNICICIEHILCLHKGYKLLDTLASFIRNSPEELCTKFSHNLSKLILDLYNKESDINGYNAKELYKVIQVFNNPNGKPADVPFIAPSGRSAKIANLVKNSPRTPIAKPKKVNPSPTALRLFGKDVETLSPLNVKGSQLNNTPPSRARKLVNTPKSRLKSIPSVHDEKSSDFVPIDSEVKFQPEKLNRHQREVLRKRREDIPALYQDLSQSQSQDMFNSSSSSQSMDKFDKENTSDNKKVIVEMISHHFPKEEMPRFEPTFDIPPQHIEEVVVPCEEVNSNVDLFASEKVDLEETLYEFPKETVVDASNKDMKDKKAKEVVSENKQPKLEHLDEKERKRRMKIEAELQKLKMDIVGADEFLAASSRRTRTREKPKRLDDIKNGKEEARASLGEVKLDTIVDKTRRKTIGTIKDIKSPKPIAESLMPQTPKSSRRKPMKIKAAKVEEIGKNQEVPCIVDIEDKELERNEVIEESNVVVEDKNMVAEVKTVYIEDENTVPEDKDVTIADKDISTEDKNISIEEKKGEKRKRVSSSCDEESEDIIESSQESRDDVTPMFNSSKRRSFRSSVDDKLDKSEEKTLIQQKTVTIDDFVFDGDKKDEIAEVEKDTKVDENVEKTEDNISAKIEVPEEIPPHIGEVCNEVEISDVVEDVVDVNMEEPEVEKVPEIPANTTQDTTITQESTQDLSNTEDLSHNNTQDTESVCMMTQDTQTQEVQTQASEDSHPPTLYFDLPKKPQLTESEQIICRMDTMSMCSDPSNLELLNQVDNEKSDEKAESKDKKSQSEENKDDMLQMEDVLASPIAQQITNLPSSPITVETPNRTTELLNNTLDISPISSKSSSGGSEIPNSTPISITRNFNAEMEELNGMEKENTSLPLHQDITSNMKMGDALKNSSDESEMELPSTIQDIINILEGNPIEQEEVSTATIVKHSGDIQEEFEIHQQLETVSSEIGNSNSSSPDVKSTEDVPEHSEEAQKPFEDASLFRHENQIEVIRPLKENNLGVPERASRLLNMVNITSPATHRFFVKKRSGGLSMSPSSGRIKRLMSGINQKQSLEDAAGEVKEEDILTFSREVPSPLAVPRGSILKRKLSDTSDDGVSPCAKRKRVNFSDPCLTSKKVFIKDDYQDFALEAKCLFPTTPETKPEGIPKTLPESLDLASSSERMTESENIETEPSLEMINPLILRKDRPIYPKLVECKEDVMVIVKKVTSPMFVTALMNKLKNKDIRTVGDLAKQSETEVNRFPFKVPVVANVYKALDNYYKKNIDKFSGDVVENGDVCANGVSDENVIVKKKSSPVKVDIRVEFNKLIERSKVEGATEDLARILLTSLEKDQAISLLKSNYKLEPKDFLEQNDFKVVIKHITDTVGLPSVFEALTESIENSENESVYFDCMIKQSIDKKPLIDLLANRSLTDIKTAIEETFNRSIFTKKEVLESCFFPLIENPSDVCNYVNKLSIVQIGEIVIQRLEFSDLNLFFDQIIRAFGGKKVVTSLSDEVFKHFESAADVVDHFKNCIRSQKEENRNEVLVEMFKFVGGMLDLNTLLDLHIGFLKTIPEFVAGSRK